MSRREGDPDRKARKPKHPHGYSSDSDDQGTRLDASELLSHLDNADTPEKEVHEPRKGHPNTSGNHPLVTQGEHNGSSASSPSDSDLRTSLQVLVSAVANMSEHIGHLTSRLDAHLLAPAVSRGSPSSPDEVPSAKKRKKRQSLLDPPQHNLEMEDDIHDDLFLASRFARSQVDDGDLPHTTSASKSKASSLKHKLRGSDGITPEGNPDDPSDSSSSSSESDKSIDNTRKVLTRSVVRVYSTTSPS
jgi:hypothetical protein